MANYREHSLLNVFLILPSSVAGLYLWCEPSIGLLSTFVAVFIYSTLFMSPDLDLCYHIKPWSLRGVLSFPFRMYARLFRHRGLSHSIFFGTLTRIIWLGGFVLLFLFVAYLVMPEKYLGKMLDKATLQDFWIVYKPYIRYGVAGIVAADLGHLVVDHEYDKW